MSVTSRYKGDCRTSFTANAGANHTDCRLRVVNDDSAMADRSGYELNAGASLTFYYRNTAGGTNTNAPNKVTIKVYYETGTGTLIRTYLNAGAEPANGASFSFFATTDGTSGGTARAGIARLYLNIIKDDSIGGTTDFNLDSDGAATLASAFAAPTVTIDGGCLRSNALAALTVNSYPAGSTFAYPDTITLTATHTQRWADTNIETVRIDATDSSDVQAQAGSNQEVGSGTTTQAFTVSDSWAASSASYGARILPIGNSAFVPTSGAILWTKAIADTGNTQDGNNVKRSSFYTVDPRLTTSHHAQINDSTFGTAKATSGTAKTATDTWYLATRITNARSEGQNGLTVADALVPVSSGVSRTNSSTTATLDSQVGWSTLMTWDAGAPTGTWNKTSDVTAPSSADLDAILINNTKAYTLVAGSGGISRSREVNA